MRRRPAVLGESTWAPDDRKGEADSKLFTRYYVFYEGQSISWSEGALFVWIHVLKRTRRSTSRQVMFDGNDSLAPRLTNACPHMPI